MESSRPQFPGTPPRLRSLYVSEPLYFITFCTQDRIACLANAPAHDAFLVFCRKAHETHGIAVGRYVIMPDHIHFFLRLPPDRTLSPWIALLKQKLTVTIRSGGIQAEHIWQRGFFDHVLRSGESYAEKWQYVFWNPVRKGLVQSVEQWPFAGEIVVIDRA